MHLKYNSNTPQMHPASQQSSHIYISKNGSTADTSAQPRQFGHIPWLDVEKVNASTHNSTATAASAARPEQNGARACVYVQASTRDRLNICAQNACTHTSRECTGALSYCPVVVLVKPVLLLSYPESRPAPRGARRRRASARSRRATTDWTRVLRKLGGSVY